MMRKHLRRLAIALGVYLLLKVVSIAIGWHSTDIPILAVVILISLSWFERERT